MDERRAIGYVRVSTEEQSREGVSLDAQKEKIRAYCSLNDLDLLEIIEDAGISAKNLNRPGVQRVLEMARKGEIKAVVTLKLDRMFRNTIDALETSKRFDTWSVALHSIQEKLDTRSAMGRFFFTLMAGLAEMERGIISERTATALKHKRANGEKTGGDVPFGYDAVDGRLVPNSEEQKVLFRIRELRDSGHSLREIGRELEEMGCRTKRGGTSWHPQVVSQIINSIA